MPLLTFESLVRLHCDQNGYIECNIALWIWRVIPLTLVFVGVTGNMLNFIILRRKQLCNKSTAIYLTFLSVSDTVVLCFGTFVQTVRNLFSSDFYTLTTFTCTVTEWLVFSAGVISCWLIVLITVERTLVTLFPTRVKPKMTPKTALVASVILIIFIPCYNGHLLYANTLIERRVNISNGNRTEQQLIRSCSLRKGEYTEFYKSIWGIMLLVIGTVIPIFLIVTGNCIVGISLIKGRRTITQGEGRALDTTNLYQRMGFSLKMFFILSGVYIVTVLPFCVYFALLNFNTDVDKHTLAKYQLIHIIVLCFLWSNFSFNFFLYFMTGSLYKKELKHMLSDIRTTMSRFICSSKVYPFDERMENEMVLRNI